MGRHKIRNQIISTFHHFRLRAGLAYWTHLTDVTDTLVVEVPLIDDGAVHVLEVTLVLCRVLLGNGVHSAPGVVLLWAFGT